jgi:hypothetical protein
VSYRTRRAVAALALGAGALAPALAAAAAPVRDCPDCIVAGASRAPLTVPSGTPLAGYGGFHRRLVFPDVLDRYPHAFWLKPSTGERDALAARALVLERGDARVVWITLDIIGVDRAFTDAVTVGLRAAGVRPGALLISASHTHSGPGAFVDSALIGFLTVDRLDAGVRDALVGAAIRAVRAADASRGPARVAAGVAPGPAVVRSRLRQPLDPDVIVLSLRRPDGAPVALVWNFAIHGTMLSAKNRRFSGDVMGAVSATLERELGVPALFVNGAEGDVSPARHGARAVPDVADALAVAVRAARDGATPVGEGPLRARTVTVALPAPRLSLRNCVGRWMPAALTLPLGEAFPRETTLTAVALGDTAWVAMPGEPATALGRRVKAESGFRRTFVAGVSNDYVGYLVRALDYGKPTYVTCGSLYEADTGERLTDRAIGLLRELSVMPAGTR